MAEAAKHQITFETNAIHSKKNIVNYKECIEVDKDSKLENFFQFIQ